MCLDANERHWLRMSRQHRKLARSDDDWLWENLLGHTDGGLTLGDMSLALLAHGNALRLPGHPPHMYLVPHLNDSLRRTGHLLLHSNSMEHVGTVLRWLQAVPWGSMSAARLSVAAGYVGAWRVLRRSTAAEAARRLGRKCHWQWYSRSLESIPL